MKKSAFLAAALVLCASQAMAYQNPYAGYSVNDKKPFYKLESSRMYAYSGFSAEAFAKLKQNDVGSVHIINYYTPEEVSKLLEVDFNSAYFASEYEKLGLLERSQLDLQTIPTPLLDFDRYDANPELCDVLPQEHLLKEKLDGIEPKVRIDKLGGNKVITVSYIYQQADKLINLNLSQLSVNDRLYMLSTITADNTLPANKAQQEYVHEDARILPVDAQAVTVEQRNALWQTHAKFVKSFKALEPSAEPAKLAYTDVINKKLVALPNDWLYTQVHFKEKEAEGCFTVSASEKNILKIAQDIDYAGIFKLMQSKDAQERNADGSVSTKLTPQLQEKGFLEAVKVLDGLDAMLMTCSFATKDRDFQSMFDQALANKDTADFMVVGALESLKQGQGNIFKLYDYQYASDFTPKKSLMNIEASINLLENYDFNNSLSFRMTKNNGSALLYTHKPEFAQDELLQQSVREWNF